MRKNYFEPELEVRKYRLSPDIFTDSDPGLHDGDEFEIDAFIDDGDLDSAFAD